MLRYEQAAELRAKGLSLSAIARQMGISRQVVQNHLKAAAKKGIANGLIKAPEVPGFSIGKTTVQYDATGKIINEWRRLFPDADNVEAWVASLEARVEGKAPKIQRPPKPAGDLLLEIPIPDHHMGMLAWGKETRGEDYDCEIATKLLTASVASVIAEAPKPQKIALVVLGDFYHADSRSQMTEKSGHVLDCDSRFAKRVDAGIDALCQCIEMAAKAAPEVEVISISGNHDWHSIKWLSRVLAAYYKGDARITIRSAITPRQYLLHGKVLLSYMHGDTMKAGKFASVIPAEVPDMWQKSFFRYGRVGHWHHRSTEEHPGVVIETLPTLAAPDSYAAENGFLSRRALTAFVWSGEYGLRAKMERGIDEIKESIR